MLDQLGHLHTLMWIAENADRLWQWLRGVKLQLRDTYPECTAFADGPPYFRTKVRFVLTNMSEHLLIVRAAEWDPGPEGVPIQPRLLNPTEPQDNAPASTLQLESSLGWQADPNPQAWQQEAPRIEVPPNRTFRVWVGLKLEEPDPERREVEIRRRCVQRRLGKLILPTRKSHSKHEVRFKIRL